VLRVRLPMFPFRVPGPARAVGHASPRCLTPLVQFTHPSEYVSGRGIVVWVQRSPHGLRHDDGTLGVFPRPPAKRISQCAYASLVDFALLQGAFPNRTAKLACRYIPDLRRALATCSLGHSLGVLCPSSASNAGSDQHRAYLTRLCSTLDLSQVLGALLRPSSCRPCFMPTTLMGFPLQRFPLPMARLVSRPRCPSRRLRTVTVARTLRHRLSPCLRRSRAHPPTGVQVPPGIRSSGQGRLAT
jgi:hypothetical protein